MLAVFLCIGLIYSIHGLLILDRAVAYTCNQMAEYSYLLQQVQTLGLDVLKDNTLVSSLLKNTSSADISGYVGGRVMADLLLRSHLSEYPELASCISWVLTKLPSAPDDESESGLLGSIVKSGFGALTDTGGMILNDDDVALILIFKPAKLNRYTSLLPSSWEITITKRQRAWLTGRRLPPGRGSERDLSKKEDGPLVYITNYGEKYHLEDCRYLRLSKHPAYLNQLSLDYDPCSVCKPPLRE